MGVVSAAIAAANACGVGAVPTSRSMVVLDDRSRPVVAGHGDRMVVMNRRLVVLRGFVASLNRRRCRIPARS